MPRKKRSRTPPDPCIRASISFPADLYAEIEKLASAHKVSLAWVVRDALEKYLAQHTPLLPRER